MYLGCVRDHMLLYRTLKENSLIFCIPLYEKLHLKLKTREAESLQTSTLTINIRIIKRILHVFVNQAGFVQGV